MSLQRQLREFGRACAEARAARGWTQAELAQRCGVSRRTITKLENGDGGVAWGTALHVAWLIELPLLQIEAAPPKPRPRRARAPTEADLDF